MKKYIGLVLGILGIALLIYNIYMTVSLGVDQYSTSLVMLGLFMGIGGGILHSKLNPKKSRQE